LSDACPGPECRDALADCRLLQRQLCRPSTSHRVTGNAHTVITLERTGRLRFDHDRLAKVQIGHSRRIGVDDHAARPPDLHPIDGAHIGVDASNATLEAYWIKAGGHGMPRVLLIDAEGVVQFEGDPGLKAGAGWKPGQETYLDGPLEKLLGGK